MSEARLPSAKESIYFGTLLYIIRVLQLGYVRKYNNVLRVSRKGINTVKFSEMLIYSSLLME